MASVLYYTWSHDVDNGNGIDVTKYIQLLL